MTQIAPAHRHLDDDFIRALDDLARSKPDRNWWRDVLARRDLVIAIRRNSINVYNCGASIFKINWSGGRISVSTHAKYLVKQEQNYVPLSEAGFSIAFERLFWQAYEGPQTLDSMVRAAKVLAGPEKTGLHPLLVNDPKVVDAEIAFTREAEAEDDEKIITPPTERRQDRLDAAVVRSTIGGPTITFFEAKDYSSKYLRASGDTPPAVLSQIAAYEKALTTNAGAIAVGYANVARALVRISEMREHVAGPEAIGGVDPLVLSMAEGSSPIIDCKPRLLILNFDNARRNDKGWLGHLAKLKSADALGSIRVRAVGDPDAHTRFVTATEEKAKDGRRTPARG
ncbi:hypothetical protein [Mesorhizobium sp.]|uniref:hypothetical protein n=1 Tax=Mesorhizobium sp. TaxID=1871066 RepID=UPI00120C68F3|nr:hypothetical protein [Mesorhizobium sp.]TIL35943.1 MAG: hypothetical protein E5Y82_22015 [Mesorhizobium sp.]